MSTKNQPYHSGWENPFADIKNIPDAKLFIEKWQNKAMRSSTKGTSINTPVILRAQRKAENRINVFALGVRDQLKEIVQSFPDFGKLHPFYKETADVLFNLDEIKKALGSIYAAQRTILKIRGEYIGNIWKCKTVFLIKKQRRAAIGRISSFVSQLDDRLLFLEKIRNELKKLPGINPSSPSVVIAGYPNVGKSTFVKTVTSTPLQVASYPFTTKEVAVGHLKVGKEQIPVQVVDTPGVLDRPLEDLKPIELRAITAIQYLATVVLYLFDPTESCGFLLENQLSLLAQLKNSLKETPILILVNKSDLLSDEKKKNTSERITNKFSELKIFFGSAINLESSQVILEQCLKEKEVIDIILKSAQEYF